ncbi:MAG: DMT family transporter [Alphaproteobacteria bacterium]|nr:DMT family transporter [Alphaproteobacteria bacterium]
MKQTQAMFFAVVAYFLWVVSDTGVKLARQSDLSPFIVMAFFGIPGILFYSGNAFRQGNLLNLRPRSWREQIGIAFSGVMINYVNAIALKHLPLTIFYVVVFTIPLMVAALSALLKHEVLTRFKVFCIVAGFCGTAIAVGFKGGGDFVGYLSAFASVAFFSVTTILMRKIATTDSVESIQFFRNLCVGIVGIGAAVVEGANSPGMIPLSILAVAAAIGTIGSFFFNKAIQNTSSTNAVQFHYTQIIWGALFGFFLWHEVPAWNVVVGSAIIIASGMVMAAQVRKAEANAKAVESAYAAETVNL